jgi:hypothetical protein
MDTILSVENLVMDITSQTPKINFDCVKGVMEIKGRSIPDNPDEFWGPVLIWFDNYISDPVENTVVRIDLEYFNIASSKRILFLLYKLNEMASRGHNVKVEWLYRQSDEEMYEVGQDYAYMVKVPFDFIECDDDMLHH